MKKLIIELQDESYEKAKSQILQEASDEDLIDELIRRTDGVVHEYLDPNLKQRIKRVGGKLITLKRVVNYSATIFTDN